MTIFPSPQLRNDEEKSLLRFFSQTVTIAATAPFTQRSALTST
ncbi:hypothetical protein [Xanthomonas campestris]